MKPLSNTDNAHGYKVASFTDAWIETIGANKRQKRAIVASFTDAWIETHSAYV